MSETVGVVVLCQDLFEQIQCQAAGRRLRFIIGLCISAGSDDRVPEEGRQLGHRIRDGCPANIAVIMSP